MASTPSDLLRLELQATGENLNTWGTRLNAVAERVEEAIAGVVSLNLTGNVTLTSSNYVEDEARNAVLKISASTGAYSITIPGASKKYLVDNKSAYTITVKTAGGTGATVAAGTVNTLYCDGTDCYASTSAADAYPRADLRRMTRNRIVNGGMQISQENGTAAGTSTGYYPVDQWLTVFSHDGTISVQQVADAEFDSGYCIKATVSGTDETIGAAQQASIRQAVEGLDLADSLFGTAGARRLVFRAKIALPQGTYHVAFRNGSVNYSYVIPFTVTAGQANAVVEREFVVNGATGGTWATDATVGLFVSLTLAAGSNFSGGTESWQASNFITGSGQSNFLGTNANVCRFGDVGLYVDHLNTSVAPEWESPDFGTELLRCQRYYEKTFPYATVPAQNAGALGALYTSSVGSSGYGVQFPWRYRVPKRATPTVTTFNPSAANELARNTSISADAANIVAVGSSTSGVTLVAYGTNTGTAGENIVVHATASARM